MKKWIINKLPHDKLAHFFGGHYINELAIIWFNNEIALLITLAAAISIEVIDGFKSELGFWKKFSFLDILATILSPLTSYILSLIIK